MPARSDPAPRRPVRLRSRVKDLALRSIDRIAGRGGSTELPIARLAPHLRRRPDPRRADGLVPPERSLVGTDLRLSALRPIFITGRFRSGTTLLWNVFRHLPGNTAYYEPLNERRWFDPARRGSRVDPTHRGVSSYWSEYEGMSDLAPLFRSRWHDRNLYMGADARDPALRRYTTALVDRAARRPVLQFNRIDFRLPWFRTCFPDAAILHLIRNPRDQWCSILLDPQSFPSGAPVAAFDRHDHFYLRLWVERLAVAFPFLPESYAAHPYRAHYLVWRLSQMFGLAYADATVAFEDIVGTPREAVSGLAEFAGLDATGIDRAVALVDRPRVGVWEDYANDDWFRRHEDRAEDVLAAISENGARR